MDLVAEKKIAVLQYLYNRNISFGYNDWGANALHVACGASGSLEYVKFLIEKGICNDINAKTGKGETPMSLAMMYGHKDVIEYLKKL